MTTKEKQSGNKGSVYREAPPLPDDFPSELRGEFSELSAVNIKCIGIVAGHAVTGGGYFGLSITDDGDSCKLVVRHKKLAFEKRCGSIKQLEALLAYCQTKLTS